MKDLLLSFWRGVFRLIYSVKTFGRDRLPEGGFILIPNHVTWVDSIILHLACPRPIRFLIDKEIYTKRGLTWIFKLFEAIPINTSQAKESIRIASEKLKEGEIVCIFPEGTLSRAGTLLRLKKGYELIARRAEVPVVPCWMDRLWGSIFSFSGSKYFKKWPKRIPYPATVVFGEPIDPHQANPAVLREIMLELGEFAFQKRPHLAHHLGREAARNLWRNQFKKLVIDGMDDSSLDCGKLLAAGIVLAKELKKTAPEDRILIVMPSSKGGFVANLAVVLAGKIPVNLNFTAGQSALESAMETAEATRMISALQVKKRAKDVPWPDEEQIIWLDRELPKLKGKIILWRILLLFLPGSVIANMLGLPKFGDRTESCLLFTSGSSGVPKGVVLSHRNIIGNVEQITEFLDLGKDQKILASLPIFHSFGFTVTLWWPLLKGQPVVTYPSPIEVQKNAELVKKYEVTLMVSTPTFLRAYIRKVDPELLEPLKLLVSGAEKLPRDLAERFEEKFNQRILEGYGLTETSPVISVNMPDPRRPSELSDEQKRYRPGSVGRLLPGIAMQIRDPETDEKLSIHETGMCYFKGPNIFEGYLKMLDKTEEVLNDGWFRTGDLARMDEDGFLYIEGRLSRFSKIGGEMVPHATVESQIEEALDLKEEDEQQVAIMGIPDEAKGEALILLTTVDIEISELRKKLKDKGVPNLWIPKNVKKIERIPTLASGKLDLKNCQKAAEDEEEKGDEPGAGLEESSSASSNS